MSENPPAFPFVLPDEIGGYQMVEPGMTLRDWFASNALQICIKDYDLSYREWAREAYALADAMLAARSTQGDQ